MNMMEFLLLLFVISQNCYSGSVTDCLKMAKKHEQERDYKRALEYYDAACILDDGYSCAKLSAIYMEGLWNTSKELDTKMRLKIGMEYSKRAYELFGEDNRKIYQIFCEEMEMSGGCLNLSEIYRSEGIEDKSAVLLKKAYDIASKKCKEDKASDCHTLAFIYYNGKYIKEGKKRGIELFEKACALKNGASCFYLYEIYKNDPKYKNKSPLNYLIKSCEYFDIQGCLELWERTKDKKYLSISCDLGHTPSCLKLKGNR